MDHRIDKLEDAGQLAVLCRGVSKTYGVGDTRVSALQGIDLDIFQGELLMIVGPSGSGKTTLISVIAAILEQDAGQCIVFGQDLRLLDQKQRARFRGSSTGFVFQLFNLLPALTAVENVAVPLLINQVPYREAQSRAREALASVGLEARGNSLPRQLSGGQQQRVAIARALAHDPQLIVCDEPTSSIDHATGRDIMATLRRIARRPDRAVVVVTHDSRIYDYADRIASMDDGRIVEVVAGNHKDSLP